MGEITDLANSAWRDHNTLGQPASGFRAPVKSEIRAVFAKIDETVTDLGDEIAKVAGTADVIGFGAQPGNPADDAAAAYNLAKADAGANGVVRFRNVDGGVYRFPNTEIDLTGVFIDNDPGVILTGRVELNGGNIYVRNPLRVDYNDGTKYFSKTLFPIPTPGALSQSFIAPGQFRLNEYKLPTTAMMLAQKITHSTGSSFVADSSGIALSTANIAWDLTNDGFSRAVLFKPFSVNGRRKLSWAWGNVLATNAHIGVMIKGAKGFIEIFCRGEDNTMTVHIRPDSGADRDDTVPEWEGRAIDVNFFPRVATWALVPLNAFEFELTLNGVSVWRMRTDEIGMITDLGPDVRHAGTNVTVNVISIIVEDGQMAAAGRVLDILNVGDSISDTTVDGASPVAFSSGWTYFLAQALDGSCGMRIRSITNLAKAGATTAEQKADYIAYRAANPSKKFDLIITALGTNDIQGVTSYASVFTDHAFFANDARTRGERCLMMVPTHYYTRAQSGGSGEATANHATGSYIRQAIKQAAASYSGGGYTVGVLDGPEIIGAELPEWLAGNAVTPALKTDNIHENDTGQARIGYHAAGKSAALLAPVFPMNEAGIELPDQFLGANFDPSSVSGAEPRLSITEAGDAAITGWVVRTAGSNNGATVATLPRCLRPDRTEYILIPDAAGGSIAAYVQTDGNIVIWTSSTASTFPLTLKWKIAA